MKPTAQQEQQRQFRETHDVPVPKVGVWLREGDARCLVQGLVPDSVRQMAADALNEFWPHEETKR